MVVLEADRSAVDSRHEAHEENEILYVRLDGDVDQCIPAFPSDRRVQGRADMVRPADREDSEEPNGTVGGLGLTQYTVGPPL